MLKVDVETREGEVILNLIGQLDMGTGDVLEQQLAEINFTQINSVIFILSNLDFIDSTGIGILIKYYRLYSGQGIKVKVLNDNPDIEEVLEIIGLREMIAE